MFVEKLFVDLCCRKHTGNIGSKKIRKTNKVIRDKSRCVSCMAYKSRFLKQKHNNINPNLFIY